MQASNGLLYGATLGTDNQNRPTLFSVDMSGNLQTLYRFVSADGSYPFDRLVATPDGSFYGATYQGGPGDVGSIFRLDASGALTTLHTFSGDSNGPHPTGTPIMANDGNLYGMASNSSQSSGNELFGVNASGAYSVLPQFFEQ